MKKELLNEEKKAFMKFCDNQEILELLLNSCIDTKKEIIKELDLVKGGGFYRCLKNEYVYQINKSHKDDFLIDSLLLINDLL